MPQPTPVPPQTQTSPTTDDRSTAGGSVPSQRLDTGLPPSTGGAGRHAPRPLQDAPRRSDQPNRPTDQSRASPSSPTSPHTAAPTSAEPARRFAQPQDTPSSAQPSTALRFADLPPSHNALICVALPGLAISTDQGQLTGRGLDGFYRAGRRVLSRCQIRVAGREPLAVQARMTAADRARFVGTLRSSPQAGPDPDVVVERTRQADGIERISAGGPAS